jgi:hypothetical protein
MREPASLVNTLEHVRPIKLRLASFRGGVLSEVWVAYWGGWLCLPNYFIYDPSPSESLRLTYPEDQKFVILFNNIFSHDAKVIPDQG